MKERLAQWLAARALAAAVVLTEFLLALRDWFEREGYD